MESVDLALRIYAQDDVQPYAMGCREDMHEVKLRRAEHSREFQADATLGVDSDSAWDFLFVPSW